MGSRANTIIYHGYTFYRDGRIISPDGYELCGYYFTYPYSHININYDGKSYKKLKAKLMYELFSGKEVPRSYIVRFKDGDPKNCAYNNLYLESRKEFIRKHPGNNKKKLDDALCQEIKERYYDNNRKKKKDAPSMRELAQMYSCSLATIQKALG